MPLTNPRKYNYSKIVNEIIHWTKKLEAETGPVRVKIKKTKNYTKLSSFDIEKKMYWKIRIYKNGKIYGITDKDEEWPKILKTKPMDIIQWRRHWWANVW